MPKAKTSFLCLGLLLTAGAPAGAVNRPAEERSAVAEAAVAAPRPAAPSGTVMKHRRKRPNVVLILVDDMRVEDLRYMPKLRRLMRNKGLNFSNAVSSNPICCPARAVLLTGQYSHNNGVFANKGAFGGAQALRRPNNTLPVWLRRAGYNTAFFGKYLHGYRARVLRSGYRPAGWNWWDATGHGTYWYKQTQWANNGSPQTFWDYVTYRLKKRSNRKIRQFSRIQRRKGKPFFIFDSYVAPHQITRGTPDRIRKNFGPGPIPHDKYLGHYRGRRNPSFDKPSYKTDIIDQRADVRGYPNRKGTRTWQKIYRNTIRTLRSVDDAVAGTIRTLKRQNQYRNTVIIFTSDNGFLNGEHNLGGKGYAYKESLDIPLVMLGPHFWKGGKTSRRMANLEDVATTIVRLARAKAGRRLDGRSLIGAGGRDGRPTSIRPIMTGNPDATSRTRRRWDFRGVVAGDRYTFARWGSKVELYDNRKDPYQLRNVAYDERYLEVRRYLARATRKLSSCDGRRECVISRPSIPRPDL